MFLDLLNKPGVIRQHKVNRSSLSSEPTSSSNSVDVVLLLFGKLVVDNQTNLLDVNTSSQKISSDQYSGRASSEFLHDHVSGDLVHFSVHGRYGEVLFLHHFGQLVDSLFGVAINQGLVDVQVTVQVQQHIHLPFLSLNCDIVLLYTFKSQFFILYEDLRWVSHEVFG